MKKLCGRLMGGVALATAVAVGAAQAQPIQYQAADGINNTPVSAASPLPVTGSFSAGGVAQGSTTSGQTVTPIGCRTLASAPTDTTAQTNMPSCDTSGALRVNVTAGGGTGGGIVTYTTTDKGGTVTAGGTAQAAIASNASRKIWCIQNDPSATEILSVRVNGTASATAGAILPAGVQACSQTGNLDTAAVSVFAATTGHRWFGFEGQ